MVEKNITEAHIFLSFVLLLTLVIDKIPGLMLFLATLKIRRFGHHIMPEVKPLPDSVIIARQGVWPGRGLLGGFGRQLKCTTTQNR